MYRTFALLLATLLAVNTTGTHRTGHTKTKTRSKKSASPCPHVKTISDCPAEGCGGDFDPELNKQKNVRSDAHQPVLRSIEWMKNLPNPTHFTARNRDRSELRTAGEGEVITVVALALAARKGGQETCNCKLKAKADTDNHIVLVDPAIEDPTLEENEKSDSETAEFTPRVRLDHPNLTQENLEPLIDPDWKPGDRPNQGARLVRVTGILIFDSEHFLRNALKRHNNWEIHPVVRMEYCPDDAACDEASDDNWVNLETK